MTSPALTRFSFLMAAQGYLTSAKLLVFSPPMVSSTGSSGLWGSRAGAADEAHGREAARLRFAVVRVSLLYEVSFGCSVWPVSGLLHAYMDSQHTSMLIRYKQTKPISAASEGVDMVSCSIGWR